jgi:hypothetical protein
LQLGDEGYEGEDAEGVEFEEEEEEVGGGGVGWVAESMK